MVLPVQIFVSFFFFLMNLIIVCLLYNINWHEELLFRRVGNRYIYIYIFGLPHKFVKELVDHLTVLILGPYSKHDRHLKEISIIIIWINESLYRIQEVHFEIKDEI